MGRRRDGDLPVYARHDPTMAALHGLVRRHLVPFVRFASERSGRPLPRYVVEEFRAYLRCGVLAHGFARARCEGCGHERLVAFSCKLRGVCPSCGGRRMSATAADVVDRVLPEVPLRQWVLSVPFALRVRLAADPAMLNVVSRVLWEEMRRWYRSASGLTAGDGVRVEAGAITFVQRFGGALTRRGSARAAGRSCARANGRAGSATRTWKRSRPAAAEGHLGGAAQGVET